MTCTPFLGVCFSLGISHEADSTVMVSMTYSTVFRLYEQEAPGLDGRRGRKGTRDSIVVLI